MTLGLPTRTPTKPPPRVDVDDEPLLDRQRFGTRWRVATWLIVFWTAFIAVLVFGAYTDSANSGSTLLIGTMLLAAIWAVGMIPLGLLWIAAWYRRRRRRASS